MASHHYHGESRSESLRGELGFAQSREAVHDDTPDRDLITKEGIDLSDDVQRAWVALKECEEFGEPDLIERAQRRYQAAVDALQEWERDGQGESHRLPYFPISDVFSKLTGEASDPDLSDSEMKARVRTLEVILKFVFQDGYANPWQAFKNFVAITRRIKPDFLGAMTAADVAFLLEETKAATSAREIRLVEDQLRQWGVIGYHALGGAKSDETRKNCAAAQKGNTNRRNGARRKKGTKAGRKPATGEAAKRLLGLPG